MLTFYSSQDQSKSGRLFVHNTLMADNPGAGKTLLTRAIPGILPEPIWQAATVSRRTYPTDACAFGRPK
ncbi:MAG: ATP-binding protein [Anaerolineales bacterium]